MTSRYAPGWPSSWLESAVPHRPQYGTTLRALVELLLVPHLVEQPPDALDVLVAHRPVRVGDVEPHADAAGQRGPVLDVALHRLPAPLVERLDAEVLDLGLAREPELLLDLDLDRQAVAVPAGLPGDVLAPHRVEPRVDVLEEPGPDVVDPRAAVRGRWALVEDPLGGAPSRRRTLSAKTSWSRQPGQHTVFERDEVEVSIDGSEGHGPYDKRRCPMSPISSPRRRLRGRRRARPARRRAGPRSWGVTAPR